jgi:hypothetical protein
MVPNDPSIIVEIKAWHPRMTSSAIATVFELKMLNKHSVGEMPANRSAPFRDSYCHFQLNELDRDQVRSFSEIVGDFFSKKAKLLSDFTSQEGVVFLIIKMSRQDWPDVVFDKEMLALLASTNIGLTIQNNS